MILKMALPRFRQRFPQYQPAASYPLGLIRVDLKSNRQSTLRTSFQTSSIQMHKVAFSQQILQLLGSGSCQSDSAGQWSSRVKRLRLTSRDFIGGSQDTTVGVPLLTSSRDGDGDASHAKAV